MTLPTGSRRRVGVLVIGGGIIGLAVGYYLSKMNFCDVEIVERESELTTHASGHNAGGLSGAHDSHPPKERTLFLQSQILYRELSNSFDFDYSRAGSVIPGTEEDRANFEEIVGRYEGRREGIQVNFLDSSGLQQKEPHLSRKRFSCGLYYPNDAQGNSKKLGECFARTCLQDGMKISTGRKITGFDISNGKVNEARTDRGEVIIPENVIVAAGPWSREVSERMVMDIPVSPVKGHLISVESSLKLVNSFVSGPKYYVIQNGSSVIIGGGEDSVGFDVRVDENTIKDEWAEGASMVPELDSLKDERMSKTACLRPYAADGLPIIGKSSKLSNVYFATGHFRTGFGLAPVTGLLISQLITGSKMDVDLSPFSPDRFL